MVKHLLLAQSLTTGRDWVLMETSLKLAQQANLSLPLECWLKISVLKNNLLTVPALKYAAMMSGMALRHSNIPEWTLPAGK